MATSDDVRRLALALPGTDEHPSYGATSSWRVGGKAFVWERPLRPGDVAALAERGEVVDAAWRVRAPKRLSAERER